MNRILVEEAAASLACELHVDPNRDQSTASDQLTAEPHGHAIFAPLHYESNYAYPLLVWLHPEGHNESHIKHVMPNISMRNYAAVAPRGTHEIPVGDASQLDHRFTWRQTEDHILLAQQRILASVEQAQQRFNIHPRRIFLAGAGNGGTMAFRIGMIYPDRFAGVASLGGAFPIGNMPLAQINTARRLPLFIASSRGSAFYPELQLCNDLRLIHSAGMMVNVRQYPGADDSSDMILADVDRWIMDVISSDNEATVVSA
jgi:phospholipase/carboxylesterase